MNKILSRRLASNDLDLFKELIHLFEVVFEMEDFTMPPDVHLQQLLAKDSFMAFVAVVDGKVIGGLTAYTWDQYYSVEPLAYIFDLAVATNWQRKGVGRLLMKAITDNCRLLGMEEVFVQADDEDTHALEFYRATGGLPERVVHFAYPLER